MIAEEYQKDYSHQKDYDYLDFEPEYKEKGSKVSWWLPLSMIPLFAFIGWTARDYFARTNTSMTDTRMEFGIGGGPETDTVPCMSPLGDTTE